MQKKTAIIRPCDKKDIDPDRPLSEQKVCLYSKKTPGKLLGRHPNEESAKKQEAVIQIHKHASDEEDKTASIKALQTYLMYEVAKHIVNYAKGKRLQKPAEKIWVSLFPKLFKITTRGPLKRGQEGGQYKITGNLLFTNGDTHRPIEILIVAAYWRFKRRVLFQLKDKNKRKPIFSVLDTDPMKIVKKAQEFISQNLVFPPIKDGDKVTIDVFPHKGRVGVVQSYQPFAKRVLVRLDPAGQQEQPIDIWFDRDQVTLMTQDAITKQFQATIDSLESIHPDLALRLAKAKEQYKAKTDLEKMIGEMVQGQSGIWLTKEQMMSVVKELKDQGIEKPKDGVYDEIAQAVGKILDKLIVDEDDKKEEKEEKEEKKGTSLNPLTQEVFKNLQKDYHFVDAHKNDIEEVEGTWFKLDYVDTVSIKNGSLVLGDDEVVVQNYLKGSFDPQSIDITQVHPLQEKGEGRPFDVLTIPAFGDKQASILVDFGSSQYLLQAETAPGLAAQIYAASLGQNFLNEKLAIKIEVEVEIDLGDLGLTEWSEEEEEEEGEEEEEVTQEDLMEEPTPMTEETSSEPMVLNTEQLQVAPVPEARDQVAPMEEPAPIPVVDVQDPRFPPVPFRWE